jgi:DNA-directed RNA polymerase specialized sigma24 family protein
VIADDHHWLRHLWAQHAGSVYAYAARRVGPERAEDVVADTFVVAWRHCGRRPHRDLPWLLGVARRGSAGRPRHPVTVVGHTSDRGRNRPWVTRP